MSVRRSVSAEGESLASASLARMKLSIGLRGFHLRLETGGTFGRVVGFKDQRVSVSPSFWMPTELLVLPSSATEFPFMATKPTAVANRSNLNAGRTKGSYRFHHHQLQSFPSIGSRGLTLSKSLLARPGEFL